MRGFTSRITILRPTVVEDEFGTRTLDWSKPERVPVDFLVSLQPLTSTEGPAERPQVITGWQLISPPGTDLPLRSIDRVESAQGQVLAVAGDILRYPHPIRPDGVHHVEAMLERAAG